MRIAVVRDVKPFISVKIDDERSGIERNVFRFNKPDIVILSRRLNYVIYWDLVSHNNLCCTGFLYNDLYCHWLLNIESGNVVFCFCLFFCFTLYIYSILNINDNS